mmetsp:Transcript_113398/g.352193  ORF Transcript_113398/g.352193 Transcript_113398/m.352193 type:complete len:210 (+) Transcript_113398:606-1235(+)
MHLDSLVPALKTKGPGPQQPEAAAKEPKHRPPPGPKGCTGCSVFRSSTLFFCPVFFSASFLWSVSFSVVFFNSAFSIFCSVFFSISFFPSVFLSVAFFSSALFFCPVVFSVSLIRSAFSDSVSFSMSFFCSVLFSALGTKVGASGFHTNSAAPLGSQQRYASSRAFTSVNSFSRCSIFFSSMRTAAASQAAGLSPRAIRWGEGHQNGHS